MHSYNIQILDTQTNCFDHNQYAIQVVLTIANNVTIIEKSKQQMYENELQSLKIIKRKNAVNCQKNYH